MYFVSLVGVRHVFSHSASGMPPPVTLVPMQVESTQMYPLEGGGCVGAPACGHESERTIADETEPEPEPEPEPLPLGPALRPDVVNCVLLEPGTNGLSTHVSVASNVSTKGSQDFVLVLHSDVLHNAPITTLSVQL